ncbi:uncharacterized protein H6S33_007938 [Morchella sextelata]|uniref:uncharacterized protein n=1 Tax=Morchella sextelata TaxID=1174677 RepID=UPI001D041DA2|nr:uncharacterized protein H6S33_007938 [Morchella sextelata]KAH0602934.1 hypothetical protein H6S33_007938 [Morchella sextelata]
MSHPKPAVSPPGSTATRDPISSRVTRSLDTHTLEALSAANTPETMDDTILPDFDSPEMFALTPSPTSDRAPPGCNVLLVENGNSMALARQERINITTNLRAMTAQKETLLHKLQHTMVSPTPEYTLSEYEEDLTAVHGLIMASREMESDLAYNWLEMQRLREQREILRAAKATKLQLLHAQIEEGGREMVMLTRMLREFNSKRPRPPSEIQYLGVYAPDAPEGTLREGEIFFTKRDAEMHLIWVGRQMSMWMEERAELEGGGDDGRDNGWE